MILASSSRTERVTLERGDMLIEPNNRIVELLTQEGGNGPLESLDVIITRKELATVLAISACGTFHRCGLQEALEGRSPTVCCDHIGASLLKSCRRVKS